MHRKAIRHEARKQLKKQHPFWHSLSKKEKKAITQQVLEEAVRNHNFKEPVETSMSELLGIEGQAILPGIMSLDEMDTFVASHESSRLFNIGPSAGHRAIKDLELKHIDKLIDNGIINNLLSYDGYSPRMREIFPSTFLRAELLKAIKHPEVSYRKFCGDDKTYTRHKETSPYIGMESKQNRAFVGLPLNRKQMISHVQMCQFRNSLSFVKQVNLSVYVLSLVRKSGLLGDHLLHCVDSSELAVDRQFMLAKIKVNGKNIRIYDDIDCDCGTRRKKRDKSGYVVGYRMHTLTAVDPKTGNCIPLISLLAAANHHDSHFLAPLVALGNAIGLNIKLVSADQAYHDKTGAVYAENGSHLVKPPNSKVRFPENVDPTSLEVTCDDFCEFPMEYAGTEEQSHEFKCGAEPGQCSRAMSCPQFRHIPLDDGCFQRILRSTPLVSQALEMRKHCERPFNLLKKREGLEQLRVRSQHGAAVRTTLATMANLLIELIKTRKTKKKTPLRQLQLPLAA